MLQMRNVAANCRSTPDAQQKAPFYKKRESNRYAKPPIKSADKIFASEIVAAAFQPNSLSNTAIVERHGK